MRTKHRAAAKQKRKWAADPMAMFNVIRKIEPFTEEEVTRLALPVRFAYESIRSGTGSEADFDSLAIAINDAVIRSESIDALCVETCKLAQEALLQAKERYLRTGRWGFDWQGLQNIPPALDLYEAIIANSNPAQMIETGHEQINRVNRKQTLQVEA